MTSNTDYTSTNEGRFDQPIVGSSNRDTTTSDNYTDRNDGIRFDDNARSSDIPRTGGDNFISREPGRFGDSNRDDMNYNDSKYPNTRNAKNFNDRSEDYAAPGADRRTDAYEYSSSRTTNDPTVPGAGIRSGDSNISGRNDTTGYTDRTEGRGDFRDSGRPERYADRDTNRADAFDDVPVRGASGYEPRDESTRDTREEERSAKKGDSTMGKIMEKAGGMMKNQNLVEKGTEKREAAADANRDNY